MDDPLPKGSVQKVLKHHTKAPRRERIVKLRLIEREVQASRVTAKGEYMIQNKHRAWIAPKGASAAEVVGISCEKGVYRDPAPKGSHDGEPDRFGSLRCWRPGRDSRSSSGECPDSDQRSKEPFVRLNRPRADHIRNHRAYKRGCTGRSIGATTGHKAWYRVLHEEKARGAGECEVHVPGPSVVASFKQRRVVGRRMPPFQDRKQPILQS